MPRKLSADDEEDDDDDDARHSCSTQFKKNDVDTCCAQHFPTPKGILEISVSHTNGQINLFIQCSNAAQCSHSATLHQVNQNTPFYRNMSEDRKRSIDRRRLGHIFPHFIIHFA